MPFADWMSFEPGMNSSYSTFSVGLAIRRDSMQPKSPAPTPRFLVILRFIHTHSTGNRPITTKSSTN